MQGNIYHDFMLRRGIKSNIMHVVGRSYRIETYEIFSPSRLQANIALARQIAMYLAHISFGLSQYEVGNLFHRDRKTVSHACKLIEDMREQSDFDCLLAILENTVLCLHKAMLDGGGMSNE